MWSEVNKDKWNLLLHLYKLLVIFSQKCLRFNLKKFFIEKPSMPQGVRVEIKNETLPAKIHLQWEPGFDGNSPIIKYVVEVRTLDASGNICGC